MKAKFINQFENNIKNTIDRYSLINKNEKVLAAYSGGKDSTTVLYLLKKFGYDVEALTIDLLIGDWSKVNLENIRKFCKEQNIKLHVVSMREEFGCSICYIRSGIQSKKKLSSCAICGVIKRWVLNKKARELNAAKLATGHNLDDEAESIMMNLFKGNQRLSMNLGPKTGILDDKKFVPRIKPLYFCQSREIKKYSQLMNFPVLYEPCPCSAVAFRREIRSFISELEKINPESKMNIVTNFLKLLPAIKQKYQPGEKMKYCRICEEPSRNDVCRRCSLISILKEEKCTIQ